jgi:biopolymer transport protein TolQ
VGANASILSYFVNASGVVKLVMLILLILSLISWSLIFLRGSYLKYRRKELLDFLDRYADGVDLTALYQRIQAKKNATVGASAIFRAGFKEFVQMKQLGANPESIIVSVERAMNIAEAKEIDTLDQNVAILATIGSTSPYIGLFGTVWGIMSSFHALGNVQQATLPMVAPGISEALVATAMGLFAAIPAVIAYNRYTTGIDNLVNQYAIFKEEFIAIIYRKLHSHEVHREVHREVEREVEYE